MERANSFSTMALRSTWIQMIFTVTIAARGGGHRDRGTQSQIEMGLKADNGCKGLLKNPCECHDQSVRCINAQYTDTDVFLNVGVHFSFLKSITFTGNNFRQLPKSLFGPAVKHMRLETLNMSSNYLVYLDNDALTGMPDLKVLDFSGNMIELRSNDTGILRYVPKLERLLLRKAFNTYGNKSRRLALLEQLFKEANLRQLTDLDLSLNELDNIPYNLGCYLPNLRRLNLRQNRLNTLRLNASCLRNIDTIDMTANNFTELDLEFRTTAQKLPDYSILAQNFYLCDCKSHAFISWIKNTRKIQDKNLLLCYRSSPRMYDKQKLVAVPLDKLDCSVKLDTGRTAGPNLPWFSFYFLALVAYWLSMLC